MPENEDNGILKCTSINSSTSSDDSGVVVNNKARFKHKRATISKEIGLGKREKQQHENHNLRDDRGSTETKNATKINIQNFINITKSASDNSCHDLQRQPAATPQSSSKTASPTVSIRSTTISIISIDENADESSVIESDSNTEDDNNENDYNQDNEKDKTHYPYIIKKLGEKATYEPNSPDIPNIGNGLTVLSQYITPDTKLANPDDIAIPNTLTHCPPPTSPQIGSIALSNSTDVTFGDKHFYEGPVTIQQFLIDHREKLKTTRINDEQDSPRFSQETSGIDPTIITKETPKKSHSLPFGLPFNRKALFVTTTTVLLLLLIGILLVTTTNLFKSTVEKKPYEKDNEEKDIFNGTLNLIDRKDWNARAPKSNDMSKLNLPVHRIIICHTASEPCQTRMDCISHVRVIQGFHMDSRNWDDIGYNFLIGGDGLVFVGRGWDMQGAHTKGYNVDSIGIAFIGTYNTVEPTENQLAAASLLIDEGVRLGKLVPNYRLYGARQLHATESPGDALYNIIKNWEHWSDVI